MSENLKPIYGHAQYPHMDLFSCNNPSMDILKTISVNLTRLMDDSPALDTCKKLAAKSGVGYGTVQRIKNAEVNITVQNLSMLAAALKCHPAELLIDSASDNNYGFDIPATEMKATEPQADRYAVFAPSVSEVIKIMEGLTYAQQCDVLAAIKMFLLATNTEDKSPDKRAAQ